MKTTVTWVIPLRWWYSNGFMRGWGLRERKVTWEGSEAGKNSGCKKGKEATHLGSRDISGRGYIWPAWQRPDPGGPWAKWRVWISNVLWGPWVICLPNSLPSPQLLGLSVASSLPLRAPPATFCPRLFFSLSAPLPPQPLDSLFLLSALGSSTMFTASSLSCTESLVQKLLLTLFFPQPILNYTPPT